MNLIKKTLADAGLHLILSVVVLVYLTSWFTAEPPPGRLNASERTCLYCSETFKVSLFNGHLAIAHPEQFASSHALVNAPASASAAFPQQKAIQ